MTAYLIYVLFYIMLAAAFIGIDYLTGPTGLNTAIVAIIACSIAYTMGTHYAYTRTRILVLLTALSPIFLRSILAGQITQGMMWSVLWIVVLFFSVATAAPSLSSWKKHNY